MFLWKLIFQNVAKYLTQNFVNKTKSVWPEGKAETYFRFFHAKTKKLFTVFLKTEIKFKMDLTSANV